MSKDNIIDLFKWKKDKQKEDLDKINDLLKELQENLGLIDEEESDAEDYNTFFEPVTMDSKYTDMSQKDMDEINEDLSKLNENLAKMTDEEIVQFFLFASSTDLDKDD